MTEPMIVGYRLVRPLLYGLVKILYNPKIINKQVIPKTSGVIMVGNHRHYFDFMYVSISTKRTVRFLAKIELFKGPLKYFFRFIGCIPVNRKIKDSLARDEVIISLKAGSLINIFPEGTRNLSNDILLPFKFGAVSFAQKTGVPIIPYGVSGKIKLFKNNLVVNYGKPFFVKPDDNLEQKNKELTLIVERLIKGERL